MSKLTVDQGEIYALLKKHKGEFRGVHVNLISIPESNFWEFMQEYVNLLNKRTDWDFVAEEMGEEYAKKHHGERP